jgi:hypothetical protein
MIEVGESVLFVVDEADLGGCASELAKSVFLAMRAEGLSKPVPSRA